MIANRNKVFVRQLEAETATASGIVIPDSVQKKQKYGTIVRIDNYDKEKYGELSIGDTVSFSQYAGEPASVEQDLLVMHPGIFYSKIVDGKHQAIGSFVLVELEHKYQKTQVVGGVELLLDVPVYDKGTEVFFNKGQRLKYSGKVVSVPTTRQFDEQGYEIDTIIKEGDEAYFRFMNASDDSFEIGKSVSDYSELTTIRVPYEDVFCIVRDGQISTIGEWVLGEPFIDGGGQEIQMPISSGMATINVQYTKGGLIESINTVVSLKKAIVRHVGSFKDKPTELKEGDIVFSKMGINFENEIAGKKYYCFLESYQVDAVLGNVNDSVWEDE